MTDRDLAILNDIRSAIESSGLVARVEVASAADERPPVVAESPMAFLLWLQTREEPLAGEGLKLAGVEIELVLRVAIEGEASAQAELEGLMALKNGVVDAVMSDPTRSGLADGIIGTRVSESECSPEAQNHFAECKIAVRCDYVLIDDQER